MLRDSEGGQLVAAFCVRIGAARGLEGWQARASASRVGDDACRAVLEVSGLGSGAPESGKTQAKWQGTRWKRLACPCLSLPVLSLISGSLLSACTHSTMCCKPHLCFTTISGFRYSFPGFRYWFPGFRYWFPGFRYSSSVAACHVSRGQGSRPRDMRHVTCAT